MSIETALVYEEAFFKALDQMRDDLSRMNDEFPVDPEMFEEALHDDRLLEVAHQKGKEALNKL